MIKTIKKIPSEYRLLAMSFVITVIVGIIYRFLVLINRNEWMNGYFNFAFCSFLALMLYAFLNEPFLNGLTSEQAKKSGWIATVLNLALFLAGYLVGDLFSYFYMWWGCIGFLSYFFMLLASPQSILSLLFTLFFPFLPLLAAENYSKRLGRK